MGLLEVEGVAAREGQVFYPTWFWAPAGQILEPETIAEAVAADPAVEFLLQHSGYALATTDNERLTISEDDGALLFEAGLNEEHADALLAYQKVEDGLMTEASFGYWVLDGRWVELTIDGKREEVFSISSFSLDEGDISIVRYGGNRDTHTTLSSTSISREEADAWSNESQRNRRRSSDVVSRPRVRSNLARLRGPSGRRSRNQRSR